MTPPRSEPPKECAVCGADIPRHAKACPECGADERTGWREPSLYDGLDLPEEAFETDGESNRPKRPRTGLPWYWLVAGLLTLVALGMMALGLR